MRWVTRVVPSENDEDRVAVVEHDGVWVVAVVDGAGGTGGGAEAAEFVVAAVRGDAAKLRDTIGCVDLLSELDTQLARTGGQAAAAIAVVEDARISGASVGDCGVWHVHQSHVDDLTRFQRRKPLLGSGDADVIPFAGAVTGTLLFATDGLLKYVPAGKIVSALGQDSLERIADALPRLAAWGTGSPLDDIGFVLGRPSSSQTR